jgi:uncharacterized membrane protein YccC
MLPALRQGRAASVTAAPAPRKAARPIVPERWIPWIFAAKTMVSALLALLIAFRFNLDQPKWSALTVFIIAQPASGLVLAKGFYRLFGNLAGAAVALLLVSLFAQERVLFIGTLAAWVGVCTAASLYARGFASYGFVISGYIAAIVGIPGTLNPGNAFYIAVARVTEVSLGIIITAAISHLVFPVSLARKLRQTISDMRLGFADYCEALLSGGDVGALRARLLGQVVASENLLGSAIFEEPELRDRQDGFERLNVASVYLIAESQLLERRLGPGAQTAQSGRANDIHSALDEAVAAIKQWRDAARGAADLVTRLLRAEAMLPLAQPLARDSSASDIEVVERIALVVRLREFLSALAAYAAADEAAVSAPARPERRVRFAVSNDPVEAFWGGLRAALAFVLASLLWILADWPSGSTAAILAAVAAGRLATMEHARQATIAGTIIVALATFPAFIIIEVLLPSAEGFATFALAMGPALFLCAFLMAQESPLTYLAGFLGALYFVSVNPLQDRMTYDAVGFINTSIAIIAAIAVAGVLYAVVVPDTPEAARRRFARRARRALVQIASSRAGVGVAAFETAMSDALVQLRRHLRPEHADDMSAWDAGLSLIGVGRELIALQSKERARPTLRGVEMEIAAFARRPDAMRLERARSAVQARANHALADLRSEALGVVAARAAARRLAALSVINDDLARGGAFLVREAGS